MREELRISGVITKEGGLLLPMNELRDWLGNFPGQRLVATFSLVGKDTTSAQRGYYYKYIVPSVQEGFIRKGEVKTEESVDYFLRSQCPMLWKPEGLQRVEQLSCRQMSFFLDWLKYYCAENFSIFIEDSRLI